MGRGLHPRAAGTYPLGEGTEATAVPAEDLLTLAAGVPSGAARAQLEVPLLGKPRRGGKCRDCVCVKPPSQRM